LVAPASQSTAVVGVLQETSACVRIAPADTCSYREFHDVRLIRNSRAERSSNRFVQLLPCKWFKEKIGGSGVSRFLPRFQRQIRRHKHEAYSRQLRIASDTTQQLESIQRLHIPAAQDEIKSHEIQVIPCLLPVLRYGHCLEVYSSQHQFRYSAKAWVSLDDQRGLGRERHVGSLTNN
jgi:hypothetical protein